MRLWVETVNKLTHKLCRKCNREFPHYNSGFTKCPSCPKLIIEDEKDIRTNQSQSNSSNVEGLKIQSNRKGQSDKYKLDSKYIVKSERKGKNLYRLTSEPRCKQVRETKIKHIRQVSTKQQAINNKLAILKRARIERLGSFCEACELECNVEYSHNIQRSLRKDLICDPNNASLLCSEHHYDWEHLLNPGKVLKFKNLETILDYLRNNDKKRYYHVTELLKIEQITIKI